MKEESRFRTDAPCPIYKQCGGCQLQHINYEGQLLYKQKQVKDVLERIGKLDLSRITVHPTLGMEDPWNYRNKAQVPVGEREGGLIAGFYQQRSHEIIDMNECLIQQSENDRVVQAIKEICGKYGIKAYNEERHKGWLRHIMVRYGAVTGEMMVVFITRTNDFPHKAKIVEEITAAFPHVKSIVQNINPKKQTSSSATKQRSSGEKNTFTTQSAASNSPSPPDRSTKSTLSKRKCSTTKRLNTPN